MPSLRAAPSSTGFARLARSNLSAQFSEQIALAAAPLAAVTMLAAGPAETGWLQTAQTLPFLLLSIPAGLIVDRASRRRLMVGAEALRTLSLVATVVLAASGRLSLPALAGLGLLGAVGTVAYTVAAPAVVPTLVDRERLGEANRRLELARSIAFVGGPALGGAVVGWTGAATAWTLAALLSGLAVVFLAGLPEDERSPTARRNLVAELKEGAGFVFAHPLLRPILLTAVVFNLAWFVLQAVFVVHAVRDLGLSEGEVGLTLAAWGLGMVAGAVLAPRLTRRLAFGTAILIGPTAGFVAALAMLATVALPSGLLAAASLFLFGAGPIVWTITTTTLRQAVTPEAMLGRVSAMVVTATFGARPLGAAIGALTAARFGIGACLTVAALGFLVQLAVVVASPVPKLATLPAPERNEAAADAEPRRGRRRRPWLNRDGAIAGD